MKLFALLARRARASLLSAVLCSALGGASNVAFLALVNARLIQTTGSSLRFAASFATIAAAMLLSYFLSRVLLVGLLQRTIHDVRLLLCQQLLAASLPQIEATGTPRLFAVLTEDIAAITAALGLLPSICVNVVIITGSFVYLAYLSPVLLAVLIVLLVLATLSYAALDARAASALRAARDEMDCLGEDFEGLIRGNRELKLHRSRRQAFVVDHLTPHAATVRDTSIRGGKTYALAMSWGQSLTVLLMGMVLFVIPQFYAVEPHVQSGYALGVIQLTGAIGGLLEAIPAWRRAQIALDKVEQLRVDLATDDVAVPSASKPPSDFRRIELASVTYAFSREGDSAFTLGPIDLSLRPGEIVFITGGNGSGKTTLAKLIAGLYAPTSGEIRLDGMPVREGSRDDYRQLFTVMLTDGHLFRSLLGLDEQEVRGHLRQLLLHPWVHVADGAFSTTDLSQGQRKRLALATALAEDRPFYIFDEWAANQDPSFREVFYRELLPQLKARSKAVLVITHDDRYDYLADVIIRMDCGKIRDEEDREPSRAVIVSPTVASALRSSLERDVDTLVPGAEAEHG